MPLLFAYDINRFFHDMAHTYHTQLEAGIAMMMFYYIKTDCMTTEDIKIANKIKTVTSPWMLKQC